MVKKGAGVLAIIIGSIMAFAGLVFLVGSCITSPWTDSVPSSDVGVGVYSNYVDYGVLVWFIFWVIYLLSVGVLNVMFGIRLLLSCEDGGVGEAKWLVVLGAMSNLVTMALALIYIDQINHEERYRHKEFDAADYEWKDKWEDEDYDDYVKSHPELFNDMGDEGGCPCTDCENGVCDVKCECGCQEVKIESDNKQSLVETDKIKYIENLQERDVITKDEAKDLILQELEKEEVFEEKKDGLDSDKKKGKK
ncbi:MAG: hypothetical protein LBH47_01580 [Christensenellaceae bacterium]|jgi:hypothetical protein|nr:hypothetical protein [Christensenellaceae bacterium]